MDYSEDLQKFDYNRHLAMRCKNAKIIDNPNDFIKYLSNENIPPEELKKLILKILNILGL